MTSKNGEIYFTLIKHRRKKNLVEELEIVLEKQKNKIWALKTQLKKR